MALSIIPLQILEIEDGGYHLFIKTRVGRRVARMLLDTGASKTVFDLQSLRHILGHKEDENFNLSPHLSTGLGTNTMESRQTVLKHFRIGHLVLKNYEVVALEMSHVNESYKMLGYKPIHGVLGSDILKKYRAVIDYAHAELRLETD